MHLFENIKPLIDHGKAPHGYEPSSQKVKIKAKLIAACLDWKRPLITLMLIFN